VFSRGGRIGKTVGFPGGYTIAVMGAMILPLLFTCVNKKSQNGHPKLYTKK
jgi:hypothetical protein